MTAAPAAAWTLRSSTRETDEEAEEAKFVCAECSVQAACLEHALTYREKEGVWGGATERERRRIIRQRRRSA